MQIQINTDKNIAGSEALAAHVSNIVEHGLGHLSKRITRVEVHLADENSGKSGQDDKRCRLEARLENHQPLVVTHHAATVHQGTEGATRKLKQLIDSTLGSLRDDKLRREHPTLVDPISPEA